ncbi:unnamed protein product [Urochloa decumbens]|uniref:Uncharacterized protein n=1 Tax=Urochloa decumbens TaxID=240449 RepID=A0ABC9DWR8_9POAL
MAMAGAVPAIIVLALGAGVLGVPEALRLLIDLAGRNPAVDIGICVFFFAIFTVQLLGNLQLVRFVRKAPPTGRVGARRGAPRAPAADYFARITLLMSLAAAVLVTACLLLVSGGPGSVVSPLVDFAAEHCYTTVIAGAAAGAALLYFTPLLRVVFRQPRNARGANPERATATHAAAARFIGPPLATAGAACALLVAGSLGSLNPLIDLTAKDTVFAVIVIGAATAAGFLLRTMHPLRAFREQRNARGAAAHAERATTIPHAARSIGLPLAAAAISVLVVATRSGARGCLDALALRPSPGFTDMAVAVAAVVGAALLARFFNHRARNAAAVGGSVAASAPAAAPRTRSASAR